MHNYLNSGRQAVRWIYILISGLAITKALQILFQVDVTFQIPSWETTALFIIFFSFISRFLLGAYRTLSYDIEIEVKRGKIIFDALSLFVQALMFYAFSLNFVDMQHTQVLIIIICVWMLIWLILLSAIFGIIERTTRIWILHNLLMSVIVGLNMYYWNNVNFLLLVSLVAAISDFWLNGNFFFSYKQSPRLRIFVAGPYGDMEPQEIIANNVERARDIGKELALKGHYPFIPHTMLHGWELDARFSVENFKEIDFAWLEFCDALYFISQSPGADKEKELAKKKGLQIFEDIGHVPDATVRQIPRF